MKQTTDLDRAVGQRIRSLRARQDVSQTALGQAIGVTFQQIQKYERGTNRLAHNKLAAIAGVLGCSVSDILGLEEAQTNPALFTLSDHAFALGQAYDRIPDAEARAAVRRIVHAFATDRSDDLQTSEQSPRPD